ncbi:DUF6531 domain-containing protein [Spartinivicinus ruber]|uniref:DUF6531 domain-containing protein n=1 Tax=Spartinivicinus ruber TaxID=2683272 RepID=UPI0013D4BEA1|nr:DUF6531 domain-containing protein [Spartinivicinus ruber]
MKKVSILLLSLLSTSISLAQNKLPEGMWGVSGTYAGAWPTLQAACAANKQWYEEKFAIWHKGRPDRPYGKFIDKGYTYPLKTTKRLIGHCHYDYFDGVTWWRNKKIQFSRSILLSPKENGSSSCTAPNTTPSVGQPIRISTGNMYHIDVDIPGEIPVSRTYNSNTGFWSHNFSTRLMIVKGEQQIGLQLHDGKYYQFTLVNSEWTSDPDVFHKLEPTQENGAKWKVLFSDNHQAWFDEKGRLLKQKWLGGKTYNYHYESDNTVITDNQGNELTLKYNNKFQLIEAKADNNYQITYQYDARGRLTTVAYPDNKTRRFHYDDERFPFYLTAVTDKRGVKSLQWEYDEKGRAIVSEIANGKEHYSLAYGDNQTTVTNPLGKKTTYYFKNYHGVNNVIKVEGHASANCAAANKNYEYFDNGLLKSKTDWQGVKTTYQYNDRGLETEKTEAAGTPQARTVSTEWHETFSLPVKVTEPGKTSTYEYSDKGQLTSQRQESAK